MAIKQLIESKVYQRFMRRLLWYSLPTFLIGVLSLLMHWKGGNILIVLGGGSLIIWMIYFLIGKVVTRE